MHVSSLLFFLSLPFLALSQASSSNLQPFTGTLGGAAAPPITNSGNPDRQFEVNGNTFVNFAAAAQRSCSIQNNACADAANSGKGGSVGACNTQEDACNAAGTAATVKSFSGAGAASTPVNTCG